MRTHPHPFTVAAALADRAEIVAVKLLGKPSSATRRGLLQRRHLR